MVHGVFIPPSYYWSCTIATVLFFTSTLCSSMLITSKTFDRFYSIIRPHKAASFNTTKRAKITIACIFVLGISYNIPYLFTSDHQEWQCLPYGAAMETPGGLFYYWLSFVFQFVFPFLSLLIMNSVIIHKLRNRSIFKPKQKSGSEGQGESQVQGLQMKSLDKQVYIVLLLVTFGFLILTTPAYIFFLVYMVTDFMKSPLTFAGCYLCANIAEKMQHSNHGINFFLYVISGKKFRTDLVTLFRIKRNQPPGHCTSQSSDSGTRVTTWNTHRHRVLPGKVRLVYEIIANPYPGYCLAIIYIY